MNRHLCLFETLYGFIKAVGKDAEHRFNISTDKTQGFHNRDGRATGGYQVFDDNGGFSFLNATFYLVTESVGFCFGANITHRFVE